MNYCILWRFVVPETRQAEFEAAYGPHGPWAELFGKAEGFIGTELMRGTEKAGTYLTIDRWSSPAAFESFRERFAGEYEALDRQLEGIASGETRIGAFGGVS